MIKNIVVASNIRRVGGAGSEMLHLISLMRANDINITILSNGSGDQPALDYAKSIGCEIKPWTIEAMKDQVVLSHTNTQFLMDLPRIKAARTIYVSGMWEPGNCECTALQRNELTDVIHVSNAQRKHHQTHYDKWKITPPIRTGYIPYINPQHTLQQLPFNYKQPIDCLGIGRMQRPDARKFNADLWEQMRAISTTKPKKILINGWSDDITKKVGAIPDDLSVETYAPYQIEVGEFLNKCNMIFQRSNEGEAFGRYVIEAMCAGVPCILERGNNAFDEIGDPGYCFLWAKTSQEQSQLASELANNPDAMEALAKNARRQMNAVNANSRTCWSFWKKLLA